MSKRKWFELDDVAWTTVRNSRWSFIIALKIKISSFEELENDVSGFHGFLTNDRILVCGIPIYTSQNPSIKNPLNAYKWVNRLRDPPSLVHKWCELQLSTEPGCPSGQYVIRNGSTHFNFVVDCPSDFWVMAFIIRQPGGVGGKIHLHGY